MNDGQFDSYSCGTETKPTHTRARACSVSWRIQERKWINKNHPPIYCDQKSDFALWYSQQWECNNSNRKKEEILQELKHKFLLQCVSGLKCLLMLMAMVGYVILFYVSMLRIPWDMKKRQLIIPLILVMTSIYIYWVAALQFNFHPSREIANTSSLNWFYSCLLSITYLVNKKMETICLLFI